MAVQNDTSRIQYNGNNSTVNAYAIPFSFFENGHIRAVVTSSAGEDTNLALGSGFTLTGAGNPNGGTLRTVAAVPASSKVTIFRSVPATQTTSYQEGGDFPAASHERALDKLTQIAQQTKRVADRALKVPESQTATPPDLPNSGPGKRIFSSDNGSFTWEENRNPPPYPSSNGTNVLVTAGSGTPPSWQTIPSIAPGPITATGSSEPRFLADRFAERVNVKDFGAVGDGIADDWLPIQRAIYAAAFAITPSDATTLTISDTIAVGGVQVPKLYASYQGRRKVIFPDGFYYISRPLVVTHGTQLWGAGASDKSVLYVDPYGQYNAIESFPMYYVREFWTTASEASIISNAPDSLGFCANLQIHNLQIRSNPNTKPVWTRTGTTATVTLPFNHNWQIGDNVVAVGSAVTPAVAAVNSTIVGVPSLNQVDITVANSGATSGRVQLRNATRIEEYPCAWYPFPMNSAFARVSSGGSSGTNTIDVNKVVRLSVGNRIRFSGGSDEYTITNITGSTTITVTPNFSRNVASSEILLIGLPAQNAICVNGGENAMIAHCWAIEMEGGGILIYGSSPAPVVIGTKCSANYAGYWLEGAIGGTFIKPSGDGNNIWFKLGSIKSIASVIIEGMKCEEFGFPSRCIIQAYADATGSDATVNVIGGTINAGDNQAFNNARAMLEGYSHAVALVFNVSGLFAGGWGGDVLRTYSKQTGQLSRKRGRTSPSDLTNSYVGGSPSQIDGEVIAAWPEAPASIRTLIRKDSNSMANGGGIIGDLGTSLWPSVSFDRSGTVFGLDITAHGLVVGDFVSLTNTQSYSPWIGFTGTGTGDPAYFGGVYFKVQSVVNANRITITVLDQGPASGTCDVKGMSYWYFHQIRNGAHVFQMPNQTMATADKSMVKFVSRNSRTQLAGLNVPSLDVGEWWAKDQLTLGGTASAPTARILTGTGAPSASAPDGSIYLRTDGAADTTLYIRAANAWVALTTT